MGKILQTPVVVSHARNVRFVKISGPNQPWQSKNEVVCDVLDHINL